jgi:hypothetical protein
LLELLLYSVLPHTDTVLCQHVLLAALHESVTFDNELVFLVGG